MKKIQEKNWFQRNWFWAIPAGGCGCGCFLIVLLFVFGVGATVLSATTLFNGLITDTEPVAYAKQQAFKHPKVLEYLGENLEVTDIVSGSISSQNTNGCVDVMIPIRGDKGSASIVIRGIKAHGNWIYEDLYVDVKGKQLHINLLEKLFEPI